MKQFHCTKCGKTQETEGGDGHILYSDGICGDCNRVVDIKEIREKARLTDKEICIDLCDGINGKCQSYPHKSLIKQCGSYQKYRRAANAQITKYNNTEIVPERECFNCIGTGRIIEQGVLKQEEDCHYCNGTGKLPSKTMEEGTIEIQEKYRR